MVRVGRPFGARRRSPVRARLGDLTNKHSTQTLENHYLFASGPAAVVTAPPPVSVSGPCGWSRAQEDQYLGAFCKGLEGSTQLFIIRFVQSYARAYAHAYPHTPTRIRMRTHTCSSFKQAPFPVTVLCDFVTLCSWFHRAHKAIQGDECRPRRSSWLRFPWLTPIRNSFEFK